LEKAMRRRDLVKGIAASAAVWPLVAVAQQPAIPVIGFLSFRSANESANSEAAFREGLSEIGYSDGHNVHIAFRWAEGQKDRLPALAADLVDNLHVSIIAAAGGGPSILAAKEATRTIPVVFTYGADPVRDGIVASLKQPEDNITGIAWFGSDLAGKRVALLHDLVPTATTMALLVNPSDPEGQSEPADAQDAARRLNLKLVVLNASTEREIDMAFATIAEQQVGGVVVASDPFFIGRRDQIVGLAARRAIPGIYSNREFASAGGLVSYGNSVPEAYRHAGLYVGRLLRGAKPSDLPVERLTKFEFVINLSTARALGLSIPASFLSLADDLIE
jgi:putative tryptophan/tyrosine transport system substrate-binding protein